MLRNDTASRMVENKSPENEAKTALSSTTQSLQALYIANENEPGSEEAAHLKQLNTRSEQLTAATRKTLSSIRLKLQTEKNALAALKKQCDLFKKLQANIKTNPRTQAIALKLGKEIASSSKQLTRDSSEETLSLLSIFEGCIDPQLCKNLENMLRLLKSYQPGATATVTEFSVKIKEHYFHLITEIVASKINPSALKTHLLALYETLLEIAKKPELDEIEESINLKNSITEIALIFKKAVNNLDARSQTGENEEKSASVSPQAPKP